MLSTIFGSFSGDILAFSTDSTGCLYEAKGTRKGKSGQSASVLGFGIFTTARRFSGLPAPCNWPFRGGSEVRQLVVGRGSDDVTGQLLPYDIDIQYGIGQWRVGSLKGRLTSLNVSSPLIGIYGLYLMGSATVSSRALLDRPGESDMCDFDRETVP
jgi:hypothetical protein